MPGAKPRSEHFVDRPVYDLAIRTWLNDFLDHWCAADHDGVANAATA